MNLSKLFCGVTADALQNDVLLLEITRRSQAVRSRQYLRSTIVVCVISSVYLWALWLSVDQAILILWIIVIIIGSGWRFWISYKVRENITAANVDQLVKNEFDLGLQAVAISAVVGAGNWLLCTESEGFTMLAVTLFSCIFAVGSTITTVAQRRMLTIVLVVNLGQGILFFATRGIRVDYGVAFQLFALLLVLLGFAKRFEWTFIELVRSDLEIKSQNESLRQSRIEIEAALEETLNAKTQNQVLAEASHDLSQPLHAMGMFISTLKQSVQNDEKQSYLVGKIEDSAEMLKQQFDGLLDLSRFDAVGVTVQTQSFDLYALCNLLLEREKPSALDKNIELLIHGAPVTIKTDPVLLGRLIGNLISNGIKYTDTGHVEVSLVELDRQVKLSVADTGCGFTEEEKSRIFDDFVQINSTGRSGAKGAGLGLPIVRRIATLLGVEVSVHSEPGVGSEFKLLFPLQPSGAPEQENLTSNSTV